MTQAAFYNQKSHQIKSSSNEHIFANFIFSESGFIFVFVTSIDGKQPLLDYPSQKIDSENNSI